MKQITCNVQFTFDADMETSGTIEKQFEQAMELVNYSIANLAANLGASITFIPGEKPKIVFSNATLEDIPFSEEDIDALDYEQMNNLLNDGLKELENEGVDVGNEFVPEYASREHTKKALIKMLKKLNEVTREKYIY